MPDPTETEPPVDATDLSPAEPEEAMAAELVPELPLAPRSHIEERASRTGP